MIIKALLFFCSFIATVPLFAAEVPEYLTRSSPVEPDLVYLKSIATSVLSSGSVDTSNDTTVVSNAWTAALASTRNIWNGYHVLYFPGGHTYTLNDLTKSGAACSNIYLIGDDGASIIKRTASGGNIPIASFTDCNHVRVSNLAFDANNTTAFAGFKFYSSTDVIIERTHFYDSVNRGGVLYGNGSDVYSILFPRGNTTSKDVIIRNNLIEDLQLEVAHCQRCLIEENISIRSPTSVGMGSFAVVAAGNVLEDITYRKNKIIDSNSRAIYVGLDSTGYNNNTFKRIKIIDNEILYITRVPASGAIRLGSTNTTSSLSGNVFEDVWVIGNSISYLRQGAVVANDIPAIQVSIGANNSFTINRMEISKNNIEINTRVDGYAIDVDYLRDSFIEGNRLNGVRVGGIRVQNTGTTTIKGNLCKVFSRGGICYSYDGTSAGVPNPANNVWDDNWAVGINGGSNSFLSNAGSGVGDSVETPLSAVAPGDWLPDSVAWDPPDLATATTQTTDLTMEPGAVVVGWPCIAAFTLTLQGTQMWCEVTTTTNVRVFHRNETGGNINLGSGTVNILVHVR